MSQSLCIREEITTNVISTPDLEYKISGISSIDDEDNTKISEYDTKLLAKLNAIHTTISNDHNYIKYNDIDVNSSFEMVGDDTQDNNISADSNEDRKLSTKLNMKISSPNTSTSYSIEKTKALSNNIDEFYKEAIESNNEKVSDNMVID